MSGTTGTSGNDNLNGGSGNDYIYGGAGNDIISGGAGSDTLDGGSGNDSLNGGSGTDTLIYNLSENITGSKDIYTGGSGIDTVQMRLSSTEWTDPAVRFQLQRYVEFLAQVKTNTQNEVSNGSASDFTFNFANGTTLTVQMMEKLAVAVLQPDGTYQPINFLTSLISGTAEGSVVEAGGVANSNLGSPTVGGNLYADDLNGPDDAFQAVAAETATAGGYGTYTLTADGQWTYTLNNNHATVQALNVGSPPLIDTFTVKAADGATKVVTVTINGANDAAVITGTASDSVTEKSGVLNGTAGDATASGDLDASDVDSSAAFQLQTNVVKSYGTFSIDAGGAWSYTLDDNNVDVQALNSGGTLTETVTVATADGTTKDVVITINGANDAAVITGTASDSVTEKSGVLNGTAGDATASGDLDASDVDSSAAFQLQTNVVKSYGTFSIDAGGAWSYTLDDNNVDVQALNSGGTLTETVTVATADGTTKDVVITINGANDAAVITGTASDSVTEKSGVLNGTAGDATASGDLDASDVDSSAAFQLQTNVVKSYGTFSIDAGGAWSYTLDDNNVDVQALNSGGTLTETVTVATADGTTKDVVITINGANDAAVITGTASDSVTEKSGVLNGTAGDATASGDLDASDVDSSAAFQLQTNVVKSYGTFSIDAGGAWSYTLDDNNVDVQALNSGGTLTETVTVATADGTTKDVVITINGANDAAVITGTASDSVTEKSGVLNGTAGDATASGDLDASDVDSSAAFQLQTNVVKSYGTFSIDAGGAWSYTLDDNNVDVQALNSGGTLTETVTVATADGTTKDVVITINGANDAAVITGTASDSVTEKSGVLNGTAGDATASGDLDASDVDSSAAFQLQTNVVKSYGTFSIDAGGAWSYTLDDNNVDVQALNSGGTLTETVTVATADGTTKDVVITINGANDAAVITGTASDSVTEKSGVLNGTAGDATASGDLDASDVDSSAAFQLQTNVVKSYGTFSIDAGGAWSYTLDDNNVDVQALNSGGTLTETVTVATADGTTKDVVITINGANDAAVITGTASDSVTEKSGVLNGTAGDATASGDLDASDVDSSAAFQLQTNVVKSYGTFSIDAGGAWSYTLDDNNVDVQALNSGGTLTETVTVATADGTTKDVVITINGANDAAVITGTASDSVTEKSGVLNGTAGDATASGDLDASDVDSSAAFQLQTNVVKSYGTFSIDAGGAWSYTLDDNNVDVQALNSGGTLTETVTVATADGTTKDVVITINGANDAAVITGTASDSVTEKSGVLNGTAGDATASGDLDASDVDSSAAFQLQTNVVKSYGTFSIDAGGAWSYTLDDNNVDVQALNSGGTLTETVTVATADGTTKDVVITINGANDAAVITGSSMAALTESNAAQSTGGDLNATDVDSAATFVEQTNSAGSNGYGKFSIDSSGAWTYTMNNAHDEFVGGVQYTDSITVATADGTTKVLAVTITGTNDGPVAAPAVYNGADANDFDSAGAGPATTLVVPTGGAINNDNTIRGTNNGETIDAGGGADTVYGYGGNDNLVGGSGTDFLYGGTGNDTIAGGSATDTIYGGSGDDTIHGDAATDLIYGGSGNDIIFGDTNDDVIIGGFGADTLTGDTGADTFRFLDTRDTGDTINFVQADGDKIDFQSLYGGTLGFTANTTNLTANGVIAFYDAGTGQTIVQADTDGNASTAELQVQLVGNVNLTSADFLL